MSEDKEVKEESVKVKRHNAITEIVKSIKRSTLLRFAVASNKLDIQKLTAENNKLKARLTKLEKK